MGQIHSQKSQLLSFIRISYHTSIEPISTQPFRQRKQMDMDQGANRKTACLNFIFL